jgi:hypothetical protein
MSPGIGYPAGMLDMLRVEYARCNCHDRHSVAGLVAERGCDSSQPRSFDALQASPVEDDRGSPLSASEVPSALGNLIRATNKHTKKPRRLLPGRR